MEGEKTRSTSRLHASRLHPSRHPVFHFVGGKGGVGKTTCAAMQALSSTRLGQRTLLVTTDPASSLQAALGVRVTAAPRSVRGAKGLLAVNVDAARAFERWLAPRKLQLAAIAVRGTYLDDEDVARLLTLSLPGIDEVMGLVEVVRLSAGFDAVVVDTAPTGHTLRLLAAPALFDRVAALLDGLQAHHRAVVSALRGSYRADAADALIADLGVESASLAGLLRDRSTRMSWVTLPEPMALEETADALAALGAAGIRATELIVNRVTPGPVGRCVWCEARRRFESRALAPLAGRYPTLAIEAYPEVVREPRGVTALRSLAARKSAWTRPPLRFSKKGDSPLFPRPIKGTVPFSKIGPKGEKGTVPFFRMGQEREKGTGPFSGRWLLLAGKGGVGKSTCAAAVAVRLAETKRVLLLSTDPAHSLGDVFGQRFDNAPRPVAGVATLHVREIDAVAEMERLRQTYVNAVEEAFARVARAAGSDLAAVRGLIDLAPPGIDEVMAIADVAAGLEEGTGAYDVIVTDTAPTGHALRLLQTPAILRAWAQALMAILLKYREITGAGSLAALLVQLSKRLRGLQDMLADPACVRVVVVTRPAALPGDESRQLIQALHRLRITVAGVIVNAAGRGTCRRCRAIARAQEAEISRVPYAIIVAPAEVPPPHGVSALRAWIDGWRQPTS